MVKFLCGHEGFQNYYCNITVSNAVFYVFIILAITRLGALPGDVKGGLNIKQMNNNKRIYLAIKLFGQRIFLCANRHPSTADGYCREGLRRGGTFLPRDAF